MISGILAIFSAIYLFAKNAVKNDPLKQRIDTRLDDINSYLVLFKDSKPSLMTTALSSFSLSFAGYSIILTGLCIVILPKQTHSIIVPFVSAMFVTCLTLHMTIQWNQNHRATIKKIYKNPTIIFFLLAPGLVFLLDILLKSSFYTIVFEKFGHGLGINGFWRTQLFWSFFAILFMYVGFWVISVPIYFLLYSTIFIFSLMIKTLHKHININIADVLFAVLAVVIVVLRVLNW
jgi:hypothetical protein